jgi:hypothetical protein
LLALLALAVAMTLWRHLRASRGVLPRRAQLARLPGQLLDTLALVGRRRSDGESGDSSRRRLEILAYRLLVVCALLGLANSNPTLRQMVDALF